MWLENCGGGYFNSINLYIEVNGSDTNTSLSVNTALKTLTGAIKLINTKYLGRINALKINFGVGTFIVESLNLSEIKPSIQSLGIGGVSMDDTIISFRNSASEHFSWWDSGVQEVYIGNLTINTQNVTRVFSLGYNKELRTTNIRIDASGYSVNYELFYLCRSNIFLRIDNVLSIKGTFPRNVITSAPYGENNTVVFTRDSTLIIEQDSVIQGMLYAESITNIYCLSSVAPIYNNTTVTNFARLSEGSKIYWPSTALKNQWINGKNFNAGTPLVS